MRTILVYGVLLGGLVVAWTCVMGVTSWYRDPFLMRLFFLVVPLEVGLLVGMLSRTAQQGRGYGGQVLAGALASLIGGALIVGGSLLATTVLFPHYFTDLRAMHETTLRAQGMSPADVAAALAAEAPAQNPLAQALAGLAGTLTTGVLTSLVAGAFIRARR